MPDTQSTLEEAALTMTVDEAAKILKIGRRQAYAAARSNDIPVKRIGGRVLVLRVPLLRMLNGEH